MICIYHNADLDGHCSAAIVRHFNPGVRLLGMNYGDASPSWAIEEGEDVVMVDFSLPAREMVEIERRAGTFTWIDHHGPAIEEILPLLAAVKGQQWVGEAACELTWQYYSKQPRPRVVSLLGRYDVWDRSDQDLFDFCYLPFQLGFKQHYLVTDPIARPAPGQTPYVVNWGACFDGELDEKYLIELGLKEIQRRQIRAADALSNAYQVDFEGFDTIAINEPRANSQFFESILDYYDIAIAYQILSGGRAMVHLFSTKESVHCGEIAKRYGGGGHKGAAGFITRERLFW